MVVHSGRNSRCRVWRDHNLLSNRLAANSDLAASRRRRLDKYGVGEGKTRKAESSLLHHMAGILAARRDFADAELFLRNDGRLRNLVLAAKHFEAAVGTE